MRTTHAENHALASTAPPTRERTVLVVDDDEETRKTLAQALENAGFSVLLARNGTDALQLFRWNRIHVVVLDIWMPDKDGVETLMEMKRFCPEADVIAISGGGKRGIMSPLAWAARLGARATLAKPFTNDELLAAIEQCLT